MQSAWLSVKRICRFNEKVNTSVYGQYGWHVFTCSGLSSDDLQSPGVVVEAVAAAPALTAAAAAAANRRSD
ncbi:hypothetical protein HZH66_003950 [Vespula vulgaris]|uniref:Uncharacterized protein n=1 Tax=Vespula vulgaris TaxID=7454 RepID=A0A834KHU2_VESVU|nr:hypothetical protein HZH66_003950 [Vespula vulgaris]